MSEQEIKVKETFEDVIPLLNDIQRSYLLGYGAAILDMKEIKGKKDSTTTKAGEKE